MSRPFHFAATLVVVFLLSALPAVRAAIELSNVTAEQRPGTTLVDIRYDVSALAPAVSVEVEIFDGMAEAAPVPASALSGHAGVDVPTGTGRHLVWDAGEDWGLWKGTLDMRFQLTAAPAPMPDGGDPGAVEWHRVSERWVRNYHPDGSVTMSDRESGLTWIHDAGSQGKATWDGAADLAENLNFAGHADWFLPNRQQLAAMRGQRDFFAGVRHDWHWTGETADGGLTWIVHLGNGQSMAYNRQASFWVWPCRETVAGEPAEPTEPAEPAVTEVTEVAGVVVDTASRLADYNGNGIPDILEDFNGSGTPDAFEDFTGTGVADAFEDFSGSGIPDAFEDHNGSGVPDAFEDFSGNGIPDAFEMDFNGNGIPDVFEFRVLPWVFLDYNGDGFPDALRDYNGNGIPDAFEDFSGDGVPDAFTDFNGSGVPDAFEDFSSSGIPDAFEDFNGNGIPDAFEDFDGSGIPDAFANGLADTRGTGTPDFFEDSYPSLIQSASHPDRRVAYRESTFSAAWEAGDFPEMVNGWLWIADRSHVTEIGLANGQFLAPGGTAVNLPDRGFGEHWFHLVPLDGDSQPVAGAQVSFKFTVEIDRTVLTSTTHPEEEHWFNNPGFAGEWSAGESAGVIDGWRWKLADEPFPDDFSWENSGLLDASVSTLEFADMPHGSHWVYLAPVDAESRVINERRAVFRFNVNRNAPVVASPSHPVEGVAFPQSNVQLAWEIADVPADSIPVYHFAWNEIPDYVPTDADSTTVTRSQAFPGQSDGSRHFHVAGVDRLGNPTAPGRYNVVIGPAQPPAAGFTADPTEGPGPLEVTFTDESAGSITTREWDFTGDGVIDAVNPSEPIQWTYPSRGTFSVTLTVTGPGGKDTAVRTDYIEVLNTPPVAAIESNNLYLSNLGETAILDASASFDPDGDPLFFSWREHPENPQHGLIPIGAESFSTLRIHFSEPGRYRFDVRVSDGDAVSATTETISVFVPGRHGVVGFTPSDGMVRVPDATLRVHRTLAELRENVDPVDAAVSDSLGRYVLANLEPADGQTGQSYWYVVERPGFQSTSELSMTIHPDPGPGSQRRDEAIGRGRVASVSGYLRNPLGEPVENATVSLLTGPAGILPAVSSDPDGFFKLHDVPKGSWVLQLLADGHRSEARDVHFSDGMPVLHFTLKPSPASANLTGNVRVAGTGIPVEDATVSLGNWIESVSNSIGEYTFTGIPEGDYLLMVNRDGFEPVRLPVAQVRAGTSELDIQLTPAGRGPTVYGTVVDAANGKPVRRATVGVEAEGGLLTHAELTDVTGFFQLRGLPSGVRTVQAGAPGYQTKTRLLLVEDGMELNLLLERSPDWAPPAVPGGEGEPRAKVAEALVYLNNLRESVVLDATPSTGENLGFIWRENPGNPVTGLLPPGSAAMSAPVVGGFSKPGVYLFEVRVVDGGIPSPNTAVVTVLAPGLAGHLHASPSDGVFGLNAATVRAYSHYEDALNWSSQNVVDSVQTRDRPIGDFVMENLEPGAYWVVARAEAGSGFNQYGPVKKRVNHGPASGNLRINLPRDEFELEGRILDASSLAPLENVRLVVLPGILSESYRTTTDATGRYRLGMVPRGSGQPVLIMRDGYNTRVSFLDVGENKTRDFTLTANASGELATLSGRVTAEYNGILLPVGHAEVILGSGLARTFTDGDGFYEITSLPPGQYYGTVRKPGFRPAPLSNTAFLTLGSGSNTLDKVLALENTGPVIRGMVVNQHGEPVPGAEIALAPPTGPFAVWSEGSSAATLFSDETVPMGSAPTGLTGADGVFQLTGVPHGTRLVSVRLPDGRTFDRTVKVDRNMEVVWQTVYEAYALWKTRHFGAAHAANPAVSGETADPNLDGVPNLLRYLFGDHPMDRTPLSERLWMEAADGETPRFRFHRAEGISDIRTLLESSTNLIDWTGTETTPRRVESIGHGRELVEVDLPDSDEPQLFWRLRFAR